MSKQFTLPNNPIPWNAAPIDYAHEVADVPYLGIYAEESTQRFVGGTRYITWDGRVFKYGKSTGTLIAYHGCGSNADAYMTYEAVGAAQNAGDTTLTVNHTGVAEDEVAGGFVAIYTAASMMWRQVIGNDATVSTTTKLYLEAPLTEAVTVAANNVEMFKNPYMYSSQTITNYISTIGVPTTEVTSGNYFWMQTWGPCIVSPGESIDSPSANARQLKFAGNYCIYKDATITAAQNAGFYLNSGSTSIAGPAMMLQISI